MKWNLILILLLSSPVRGLPVNKGLDFISLSAGLEEDYKLPSEYKKKSIKLEIKNVSKHRNVFRVSYFKKQNKLRFYPLKEGLGIVLIKDKKNKVLKRLTIDVDSSELHFIAKEVDSLLETIDGITVKVLNNKIVIDGQIFLPKDMDRIQAVVAEYKPEVLSLVTFSPDAQNQIARLIEKEIGNPEVTVKASYNKFILEGFVNSEEEKKRADLIANLYTQYDAGDITPGIQLGAIKKKNFNRVTNLIEVRVKKPAPEEKKLIQVTIHYVGLKKDYNKGFLFQWTPIIDGDTNLTYQQGAIGNLVSTVTATVSNFFPKLNWAKSFGFARILHNANIMVQEGQQGQVNVTTGIPVVTVAPNGTVSTQDKNISVATSVKPTITGVRKNLVSMQLNISVGNVIGRSTAGPITATRKLNTVLHVKSGFSAVVGGLISSALLKDFNRLPSGSKQGTPLINLISGKNYDSSQSQFVVFITPTIKNSASIGAELYKDRFKVDQE